MLRANGFGGADWTTRPSGTHSPEMYKRGKQLEAAAVGKGQLRPGSEKVPEAITELVDKLFKRM